MSDQQIRDCPTIYYNNCKNSQLCCNCAAGWGQPFGRLFYKPKEVELIHPYQEILTNQKKEIARKNRASKQQKRSTKASKRVRGGLQNETKRIKKLDNAIKKSQASGATYGDGDYSVLGFQVDVKTRFTKQSFTLTWDEYLKGRSAGTSIWEISIQKETQSHTVVVMTADTYHQLVQMAKRNDT